MIERELPTKAIQALWRMAGAEAITINELSERLLAERLQRERKREHKRLKRERSKGKVVNAVCWDGEIHLIALSKETWRILWREAGDKSCTIDELIECWVEQWYALQVKELKD